MLVFLNFGVCSFHQCFSYKVKMMVKTILATYTVNLILIFYFRIFVRSFSASDYSGCRPMSSVNAIFILSVTLQLIIQLNEV